MNIGEKDEIFNEFFYQIFHRSFVRIQFQRISFEKQERFRFLLLFFFFFEETETTNTILKTGEISLEKNGEREGESIV